MSSFLSSRATAAHLALAAVAPLVLCKYLSAGSLCAVMVWVSVVVVLWAFMAPAQQGGEGSPDARRRFLEGVLSDPFPWATVVFVVYSAVVACNSGVDMVYDADISVWRLSPGAMPSLPGSTAVSGIGFLTVSIVAFVLYSAVVHSLDSRQAVSFSVILVAFAVPYVVFQMALGKGALDSPVAYGLMALVATSSALSAVRMGNRSAELVSIIALSCTLVALVLCGCPQVACVFVSAVLVLAAVFLVCGFRTLRMSGVFRSVLLLFLAFVAAAAAFQWLSGDWESLVPVWRTATDAVLDRLSVEAWLSRPWLGVGAGAFPLAAKLGASPADWSVLGAVPDFGGGGLRTFLAERGMVGVVVMVIGSLGYTWFKRVRMRGRRFFAAAVLLLPVALIAVAVSLVFDDSALRTDAMIVFVSLAAMSVNGGI